MKPFSIYLHIPYCLHKCPYCDFNTYAVSSIPEREYVAALLAELDYRVAQAAWRGRTVRSIYFGGGTPSLFSAHSIARIVSQICRLLPVDDRIEISIEANPGTVEAEELHALRCGGINRLSLGAQSFNRDILKTLGRMHSPEQVEGAISAARAAGIDNVSLDLIFAAPKQELALWLADLSQAIALKPQHISIYGLTIEKGTPFYQSFKRGLLRLPDEEVVAQMMERAMELLTARGFKHYEISNFALPGFEARHNLAYWEGQDYLGLGAGAHSYLECAPPLGDVYGMRWSNYALPEKYMKESAANGQAEAWRDSLNQSGAMFEYFFLGLRKLEGVSLKEFERRFGLTVDQVYGPVAGMLKEQGLLDVVEDRLALTQQGVMLCDNVVEFFADPSPKVSVQSA